MKVLKHILLSGLLAPVPLLAQSDGLPDVAVEERDNVADTIYTMLEHMPEFPGGENAMLTYLAKNLKYPVCVEGEGTVMISFVVEPDGRLSDVRVLRGVVSILDHEAMRVVKAMPPWIPGRLFGDAVRVKYVLPVRFALR